MDIHVTLLFFVTLYWLLLADHLNSSSSSLLTIPLSSLVQSESLVGSQKEDVSIQPFWETNLFLFPLP